MSYVYIRSEPRLWTVGHYYGDGQWEPESDHSSEAEAAARVAWLNGEGPDLDAEDEANQLQESLNAITAQRDELARVVRDLIRESTAGDSRAIQRAREALTRVPASALYAEGEQTGGAA